MLVMTTNRFYAWIPDAVGANKQAACGELSNYRDITSIYISNTCLSARHIALMTRRFLPFQDGLLHRQGLLQAICDW